ncbi:MAG: DUF2249 domain-containing protein [Deltaproteobacteria bacterium]|jgi:uncharacterized protein (DUF2249 family)|nr:DUF2249 domain-containing protein [Deltaproteobacteria bacterium]
MQAEGRTGSGCERIRHARADGTATEAALASVVSELQALPNGCVLEIAFDFDPSDLLGQLVERGTHAQCRKIARRRWVLSLQPPGDRELIDLCDLEAPLPLERILEATAALEPGQALIARTPCFPNPLLAQLDHRGLDWEAAESEDESALVWIGRPA